MARALARRSRIIRTSTKLVHRFDRSRQTDPAGVGRKSEAGLARVGRQITEYRFPDADLEDAVPTSLYWLFDALRPGLLRRYAGIRAERLPRSLRRSPDPLRVEDKGGRPAQCQHHGGAAVSKKQFNRVNGYLGSSKNEGAKTAVGGEVRPGRDFSSIQRFLPMSKTA